MQCSHNQGLRSNSNYYSEQIMFCVLETLIISRYSEWSKINGVLSFKFFYR